MIQTGAVAEDEPLLDAGDTAALFIELIWSKREPPPPPPPPADLDDVTLRLVAR